MRMRASFDRGVVLGLLAAAAVSLSAQQQTPVDKPDIPAKFTAPTSGADYVKRVEMIPMRDGVKLYTVIVVPKGANSAPIIMTRTPYNAAGRTTRTESPSHAVDAAPGRRSVRRRRLHPRLPGRARQVRIRRRLPDDPAAARAAQRHHHRPLHRRLRHHRLAGEARAGVQRPRRHARQLLRGLHRGDGAGQPAPGAARRRADEPDGRRLDGRRLVPLRRVPPDQLRLLRRPEHRARHRQRPSCARATTTTRTSARAGSAGDYATASGLDQLPFWRRSPSIPPTTSSGRARRSTRSWPTSR